MAAKMRSGVVNVVVLVILAGFLITIFQAASVESLEKKADKVVENCKKEKEGEATKTSEKTPVGDAGKASWEKVKSWASVASDKLPKSFSFKKTAPPTSQDSHGTVKQATQDVTENAGSAAKKTGDKIKQTAGKAHGEL